jgi:cytochrome oxidase assembly protein ShyY1
MSDLGARLQTMTKIRGIIDERIEKKPYFMQDHRRDKGIFAFRDVPEILGFLASRNAQQTNAISSSRGKTIYVKRTDSFDDPNDSLGLIPCNKDPLRETPHLEYFFTWLTLGALSGLVLLN